MAKPSNSTKIKYVVIHPDDGDYRGEWDTLEKAIEYIQEQYDKQYWNDFEIYEVTRKFKCKAPKPVTRDWVEV